MVMVQRTVYVDYAHICYIEQQTKLKYQEWVRQMTARTFNEGSQQIIKMEIPDLRCRQGHEWEYIRTQSLICEKCGEIGEAIKG